MNANKIKQLADFFYSSDSAEDVPLRMSITTGSFSGFDLSKEAFIELFNILNHSVDLTTDLKNFRGKYGE